MTKKRVQNIKRGKRMYAIEKVYTVKKKLKNHNAPFRGSVGSIEGPRRGFDPIEVNSLL